MRVSGVFRVAVDALPTYERSPIRVEAFTGDVEWLSFGEKTSVVRGRGGSI